MVIASTSHHLSFSLSHGAGAVVLYCVCLGLDPLSYSGEQVTKEPRTLETHMDCHCSVLASFCFGRQNHWKEQRLLA